MASIFKGWNTDCQYPEEPHTRYIGTKTYPGEIIKSIKNSGVRVYDIDALEIAKECGTTKAVNIVLIGVLSRW